MKFREAGAKRDANLMEEAGKTASEAIENMRTVQSLTREKFFYDKFAGYLYQPYREGLKQAHIQVLYQF